MSSGRGALVQFSLAIVLCGGCHRVAHEVAPSVETDRQRKAASEASREDGLNGDKTAKSSPTSNKPDKERLQGIWKLVGTVPNESTDAGFVTGAEMSIDCSLWRIRYGRVNEGGQFDLDASTTPKKLTLYTFRDDVPVVTFLGIYRLDGDNLEICWVARPTSFDSTKRPSVVTTWTRTAE